MRRPLGLLLTALALVVGLLGSGAAADPAVPGAPTLTLTAASSGRIAKPITLTARVTDATGAALAGTSVRFQRLDGSVWTDLGAVVADSTGSAVRSVVLASAQQSFRAVVDPTTDGRPGAVSAVVAVTGTKIATRLTLSGPWWVVDERSRTISATWRSTAGENIDGALRLQRWTGSSWVAVMTRRTYADGVAQFTVAPRQDTRYRVLGSGGTWWLGATSASHVLDNRPPVAPVTYPAAAPRPRGLPLQPRATGTGANARVSAIPDPVWRSMVGRSWHRGCPVGRSGLRLVKVNYWGFNGYRYRGELVVNKAIAAKTVAVLRDLYAQRLPIRRMYRVDRFGWSSRLRGANDYASMSAGNTSAFNCRGVVGNPSVRSPHSYGRSVDINTWENPYVSRQGIVPNTWWHTRSHPRIAWRSGSHPVIRIFRKHGFRWTYGNNDAHHYDGRFGARPAGSPGSFAG